MPSAARSTRDAGEARAGRAILLGSRSPAGTSVGTIHSISLGPSRSRTGGSGTLMDEMTLRRAAEGGMEILMVKHIEPQAH